MTMVTNNTRVDEVVVNYDVHALVLRAVHQEFLDHGLVPRPKQQQQQWPAFVQSSTGAFPPLRYGDAGGVREIEVRALAMFDDLIVHATVISPRSADDTKGETETRRRVKLNVSTWAPMFSSGDGGGEAATGDGDHRRGGCEQHQQQGHQVMFFLFSCV